MTSKLMNRNGENLIARKKRSPQNAKTQVETTVDGIKITIERNDHVKVKRPRLLTVTGKPIAGPSAYF